MVSSRTCTDQKQVGGKHCLRLLIQPPKKLHPNVSLPKKKPTKKNTEIPLETRKSSSFQFGISRRGNGGSTSGNASGQSSNENSCYLRLTAYEKMLALKWIERVAYI